MYVCMCITHTYIRVYKRPNVCNMYELCVYASALFVLLKYSFQDAPVVS